MRSLWMVVAAFMFACMGVLVKLGAAYFSSTELVFYRSLFGVWMTYLIIRYYRLSVRTPPLENSLLAWNYGFGQSTHVFLLPDTIAFGNSYFTELHVAAFRGAILYLNSERTHTLAINLGYFARVYWRYSSIAPHFT